MGSPLHSLSNFPGIPLAKYFFTTSLEILAKAPDPVPVIETPPPPVIEKIPDIKVTSVYPSRWVLIAGAVATIAVVSFIVSRIISYFSRSSDLSSRASSQDADILRLPPSIPDDDLSSSEKPKNGGVKGSPGFFDRLVRFLKVDRHHSKFMLFRNALEQYQTAVNAQTEKMQMFSIEGETGIQLEFAKAWNELVKSLTQPTNYQTADEQYYATVDALRKCAQLYSTNEDTLAKFAEKFGFVKKLSYQRFAGVELVPHGEQLLELVTGKKLPTHLSLERFLEELLSFVNILEKLPEAAHDMNGAARELGKFKGTANLDFDPGKTSNIPYRDGILVVNGKSVLVLWHGTPIIHNDPYGLAFDLTKKALSYVPGLNKLLPAGNPVSTPPTITADYVAFIEQAEEKGENILHVILENGEKKGGIGDESPRVEARLHLGIRHPNFYPLVLRLDGHFFERHDKKGSEPIAELKARLKRNLLEPLMTFDEKEDLTASVKDTRQTKALLSASGFCIPQKLRQQSELEKHIDRLLDEVEKIYFPSLKEISTVEQHQAFCLFSYAHIILFICWKMDIKILEALCKDDKDRGNVVKTILKLHFLYITGQLNHANLLAVWVHTLARPFIVQKNAIIKSRLVLLQRVIPFITNAYQARPFPATTVFGGDVKKASYTVAHPPGQTIYPDRNAKTHEEYQAFLDLQSQIFLDTSKPRSISLYQGHLIDETAQPFYCEGQLDKPLVEQRVNTDGKNFELWADKIHLNLVIGRGETLHSKVLEFLTKTCQLSEIDAWKVSCCAQETVSQKLQDQLNVLFENQLLGISVVRDKTVKGIVQLNKTTKGVSLQLQLDFKISKSDGTCLQKIKATANIRDHRTGQAQFKYEFVKA